MDVMRGNNSEAKLIPLSRGKAYAIIDAEDFEFISRWKWCYLGGRAVRNKHLGYKPGTHWSEDKRIDKKILMHRLLVAAPVDMVVDHINGNPLDNRKENLRVCTWAQNTYNRVKVRNRTGYKGVYFDHRYGQKKWIAQIGFFGKTYHLAVCSTPEEAAKEYDYVAKQLFGEYAHLNFGGES